MATDGRRHVLAIGGTGEPEDIGRTPDGAPLLIDYAARLSGAASPRIGIINTATGDDPAGYLRTYGAMNAMSARISHLQLFPMPNVPDPAEWLLAQDVVFVGGGSVANAVAVWRVHGLDEVLRQAWETGVVLSGVSAGAICWFAGGTTDSFGVSLRPFTAGLGLLPGTYCPHYDAEARRRPLFQSLVGDGTLEAGIACDDGAAAHFVDDELAEIVADRPGAHGYRVERSGDENARETVLDTRVLGS